MHSLGQPAGTQRQKEGELCSCGVGAFKCCLHANCHTIFIFCVVSFPFPPPPFHPTGVHPEWAALCEWKEGAAHGQEQVLWRGQCITLTP